MVLGGLTGGARVYDPTTRKLVRLPVGDSRVGAVDYHPLLPVVATAADDETVRLWDARSGTQLASLQGHPGGADEIVFSPDGKWLATVGSVGPIRVWELATILPEAILSDGGEGRGDRSGGAPTQDAPERKDRRMDTTPRRRTRPGPR